MSMKVFSKRKENEGKYFDEFYSRIRWSIEDCLRRYRLKLISEKWFRNRNRIFEPVERKAAQDVSEVKFRINVELSKFLFFFIFEYRNVTVNWQTLQFLSVLGFFVFVLFFISLGGKHKYASFFELELTSAFPFCMNQTKILEQESH